MRLAGSKLLGQGSSVASNRSSTQATNDIREAVKVSHRTNKKSEQSRSEEGMELSSPVDTGRRN